jgi:predicted nucleic acid-binding protein
MILLDTNVISELMKPEPNAKVLDWLDLQDSNLLLISTITVAEIRYGLNAMPKGQRHIRLEKAFNQALRQAFTGRILPFCLDAANRYGEMMATRKADGHPLSIADGQIAAIAHVHHCVLATRNTKDFLNCGLSLLNPFHTITKRDTPWHS